MAKSEIKLRKQLLSGDIQRHRNYDALIKKHKRSRLFRGTLRFFFYSLIVTLTVLLLVGLSFYIIRMKQNQEREQNIKSHPPRQAQSLHPDRALSKI